MTIRMRPGSDGTVEIEFSADGGTGRDEPVSPLFDPWSFDFEAFIATRPSPAVIGEAWFLQAFTANAITHNRAVIEADGYALLDAVAAVAKHGLRMPDWLADAYLSRWRSVTRLAVHSLDEAFGPLPKGLKERRKNARHRSHIPRVCAALVAKIYADPNRAVDNDLFEEAASELKEDLGMGGATYVEELYREGLRDHDQQDLVELKKVLRLLPRSNPTER